MKLLKLKSEYEISRWAYQECFKSHRKRRKNNEMKKLIVDPEWAYMYCLNIKDIEEMWRKITDFFWAYMYCMNVKDRPEVKKYTVSSPPLPIIVPTFPIINKDGKSKFYEIIKQ